MNENSLFWKVCSFRSTVCFFVMMLLFLSCILRVATVSGTEYSAAQTTQNRLKISVSKQRGTIYDCNMIPITNSKKKIIAAVSPVPRAIAAVSGMLTETERAGLLEQLKNGKPVLTELPRKTECDGVLCTEIYEHSDKDTPAIHLIGYTDRDMKGISGIEKAYEDILYCDDEVYFSYECDGKGRILEGGTAEIFNNTSAISSGVVSTIDINMQNIAEEAALNIETGAIIIAEAATGKIRACVSRPYFDCTKTAEYLNAPDSPLLNRAINAYNVGSVFKPCVAIAGIESGLSGFNYTCTGSCEIIDRHFKCHKITGHGNMVLKSAIANSCNTFFYNYSFNIGKDAVYNTACALRFGRPLPICRGIETSPGNIPDKSTLENIAMLANFSIGQGELLLSPVSMLTLYSAIASNGAYYIPSAVEGTVSKGHFEKYDCGKPTRVMKESTAATLRECLCAVLEEGTGSSAKPQRISAAGKTATAQTGKYENGKEICQGWFCGYFPAEKPLYTVIVFSENTSRQSIPCGKVFAFIADRIAELKGL